MTNALAVFCRMDALYALEANSEAFRTGGSDFLGVGELNDLLFTYFAGGEL